MVMQRIGAAEGECTLHHHNVRRSLEIRLCAGASFQKNCVNSSANAQQKGRRGPFRKFLMEIFRYKF